MKRLTFCLLFSALGVSALALEWKTRELTVKALPLQRIAETAFEFTNSGEKTVTILDLGTSCDCTEATPSTQTIAPGTSGQISARFTLGDRHGVYDRFITVTSDDTKEPVSLRVRLDVPEPASLTPRVVEWKLNGPTDGQVIDIIVAAGIELNITGAQATGAAFSAQLETLKPGRHYRLMVTPQHTHTATQAAVRLHAETPIGQSLILSAYATVK